MSRTDENIALGACVAALGTLVVVAGYQSGMLDKLPDPPGAVFASERITSSKMAHPAGIPDSYLGLASYAGTLALLLLSRRRPWARQVLGFKLASDAGAAGFNAARQVVRFGKLCSWCTGTALATAVMVYAGRSAVADAVRSVRELT